MKSKLKQWLFRFFGWQVEVKLKRLDGAERILYLANLLMDECEVQGFDTKSTEAINGVQVSYHTQAATDPVRGPKYPNLHVHIGRRSVGEGPAGFRTGTEPKPPAVVDMLTEPAQ